MLLDDRFLICKRPSRHRSQMAEAGRQLSFDFGLRHYGTRMSVYLRGPVCYCGARESTAPAGGTKAVASLTSILSDTLSRAFAAEGLPAELGGVPLAALRAMLIPLPATPEWHPVVLRS